MHIVNHKIIQHFITRMDFLKQNIKKKENLKFNFIFCFFTVFIIFTRPDNASGSKIVFEVVKTALEWSYLELLSYGLVCQKSEDFNVTLRQ